VFTPFRFRRKVIFPQAYATSGATASLASVSAGRPTTDINVALTPKANIGGRVRDTSGQPLINAPVQLLRYSYDNQGQRSYQAEGTTSTDDRGEYRMAWVTPGRYYLLVGKPSTASNASNSNEGPSVLDYAFYPGVREIANAVLIDLQPGMDLPSVDLTLEAKPRTFKARGKIVDSRTSQSPVRTSVFVVSQMPGLDPKADSFGSLDVSSLNYDGKTGNFEIRDLLPGTYSIVAIVTDMSVPGEPGPAGQSSGLLPVNVTSSDIDDLTITVAPAGTIPGRVRIDGQLPAQMAIDRLLVRLVPAGTNVQTSLSGMMAKVLSQNPPGIVAADGTFRLSNIIPGDYRLEFYLPIGNGTGGPQYGTMQAANVYIKDARMDGVDALNAPIHFSGSVNNGLEITLAFGRGRVEVTVTDARLQPVSSGRVVAVPERARFRVDLFRSLSTDENGRSAFPALPPGDYKIFAWESIEEYGWFDPDLLARSEGRAASVHVSASATQAVTVQITPAEGKRQ
jgi:protocatechuate 3,4-dioxygenase beta subunit